MPSLAIIPARGGSKRIHKKNIKDFLGKPIIAYSIDLALSSGLFDEVIVSTEDDEISQIASLYGAKVPFKRSMKNSTDFATTFDVIEEVLLQYKQKGVEFDFVCCLYPCAPFITNLILKEAFWKLINQHYDIVFPIIKYSSPIQRALRIRDNKVQFINPDFKHFRTQDFEKKYFDAGQFYFFKPSVLLNSNRIITENSGFIILNKNQVEDIDELEDWEAAEFRYKYIHNL